jgi:hypothetical protein
VGVCADGYHSGFSMNSQSPCAGAYVLVQEESDLGSDFRVVPIWLVFSCIYGALNFLNSVAHDISIVASRKQNLVVAEKVDQNASDGMRIIIIDSGA